MASITTRGRQGHTPEPQSIVLVIDFPQYTVPLELDELKTGLRAQVNTLSNAWLEENHPGTNRGDLRITSYEVEEE